MGFFDEFEDGSGLDFVGKEEKEVLISNEIVFPVTKVTYSPTGKFGPRFLLFTILEDEERVLSFSEGSVESRDRLLVALQEYLEREDSEPPKVRLERKGQSILIKEAQEEAK